MPFRPQKDKNLKRAVEHKLYLAQERPDELFDLSDCAINEVPAGTYSLIKVLRKTHLYLQNNCLSNLEAGGSLLDLSGLLVLNLSSNHLQQLPDSLKHLTSLEVLDISRNRFSLFPRPVLYLRNLKTLNVEDNYLKSLPPELGGLCNLTEFLLTGNPICELPDAISRQLSVIRPKIANLKSETHTVKHDNSDTSNSGNRDDVFGKQASPRAPKDEINLFNMASENRQKILFQLEEDEERINSELSAIQRKRDEERQNFISALKTEDEKTDGSVLEILSKHEAIKYDNEQDDETRCKLFDKPDSHFRLRREEVLASIQSMLERAELAYEDHQTQRQTTLQHILEDEHTNAFVVEQALSDRYRTQLQRISEQASDCDVQKSAFAMLRAERDARMNRLRQDVALIEQQLCNLTMIEQKFRDEREEFNQRCLFERRQELVLLLKHIKQRQARRQLELEKQLEEMERRFSDGQRDYWLIQYQRLMDCKPPDLGPEIEPELYKILSMADALQFLPNFQYHNINCSVLVSMTDLDLQRIGIYSFGCRHAILRISKEKLSMCTVPNVRNEKLETSSRQSPSFETGSSEPSVTPTAPPADLIARFENECCVCQNAKCSVIFMSCGHVCTCNTCSQELSVCPLCRSSVVQRIKLQH